MNDGPELEELLRAALRGSSAAAARAAVAGAAAALRTASDPVDPTAYRAAEVLAGLVGDTDGTVPSGVPAAPESAVHQLADAYVDDPEVALWLGATVVREPSQAQTWQRIWLSSLRLPPELAEHWRARARAVVVDDDPPRWVDMAADDDAVLVEPGFGVPGLRESPDVPVPADVPALPPRWAPLATLAGQVLTLAALDPALHHALESRRSQDVHPLAEQGNLDDLRRDLVRRLAYLARAEPGTAAALRELTMVDEALCSVVHVPPAHPDSWWGTVGRRSRAVLSAAAAELRARGADVEVRVIPPGDYTSQERWIGRNNVACPAPGRPASQILACLRAYLRLGADVYPGRVVYVRDDG